MDVEPLIYNLLVAAGKIEPEQVTTDLARGAFSTVVLNEDVFHAGQFDNAEIGTLPAAQIDEVRKHYRLIKHIDGPFLDGIYVYQPTATKVASR